MDEGELYAPLGVTPEVVKEADIRSPLDRKLFLGALSSLLSLDAPTRTLAANALGYIRHELSTRALVGRFPGEVSPEVRAACINALRKLEAKDAMTTVVNGLDDGHEFVRLAAVQGVYRLAGREGASLLVRMLQDHDEIVRRRAATCLGWLEHEPAEEALSVCLEDDSPLVRWAALDALANLKSSRSLPRIVDRLNDEAETVRKKAFQSLQSISRACGDSPEIAELAGRAAPDLAGCFG
jgi:HEAT repeat protein